MLTSLGEVAEVQHGWAFKGEHADARNVGHPRLIRIGNFAGKRGDTFRPDQAEGYVGDYPKRFELSPGDLLIAMTCQTADGSILGWPMRVPSDGAVYLHNQRIGKVVVTDESKVTLDYLELMFRTETLNNYLFQTASGSKILHTAPTRIDGFKLHLPPLDEQRRIAQVLGALDDLIDTNETLIAGLRELQGGVVRDLSERTNHSVTLGSVASVGRAKSIGDPETPYLGLENFAEDGRGISSVGRLGDVGPQQQAFQKGDLLYGRLRPYFRKVDRAGFDGSCSGEIWVVKPTGDVPVTWLTAILSTLEFTDFAMAGSEGTKMPRAKWDHVKRYPIPVPDDGDLARCHRALEAFWEQIWALQEENEQLRRTRDELLPLLMSGAVRVRPEGVAA